jgi:hypothetical protein
LNKNNKKHKFYRKWLEKKSKWPLKILFLNLYFNIFSSILQHELVVYKL